MTLDFNFGRELENIEMPKKYTRHEESMDSNISGQ